MQTPVTNTPHPLGPGFRDSVVELDEIAVAENAGNRGESKDFARVARFFNPDMQLVMRLSFTMVGAAYCLLHMRAPLLLSRPVILGISALFFSSYIFFHYLASTRAIAANRFRGLFLLDAAGSHMLWLLDPFSPAPMMMMIMMMMLV